MEHQPDSSRGTSRRSFVKTSIAAAAAGAFAVPSVHAAGSDTLKVGLVGAGGRGTGAASDALSADNNTVLWSIGDAFEDVVKARSKSLKDRWSDRCQTPVDRCFAGPNAYQEVINSGVDVVLLTSPPGFRPAHIRAAVAAGKHIFTEKPMFVDGPGYRSVMQSVEEAKQKKLAIVAGFCWRYSTAEREIFKRIHEGAIGEIVSIYSTYLTSELWSRPRQPSWSDMEWQVRNWLYFTWLSGDHIVEQAVHTIDKIGWAMKDQAPLRAVAVGGRQTRTDPAYGHIFDHFGVMYEFAGGVRATMFCRQQNGCFNDTSDYIMGAKGLANITGGRPLQEIRVPGQEPWRYDGPRNNMYQAEHVELFESIRKGQPINDGPRMCNSTMMAILGRMAAYTGSQITWQQAITSQESLVPERLEWGPLPTPPIPMPGKTKFL